ncbi:MAG: Flp family type IVb pilin [Sphingomicrobium sp.]
MGNFIKLIRDRRGASAIEYALIASLISVAAIVSFSTLGDKVGDKYDQIDNRL